MSARLAETIQELRGAAMRGLVQAVHDGGEVQTVDVITHDGFLRQGIEVFQFSGFAPCAPAIGSVVQLAAIGADPGDLIALPPVCPAARYGGLAPNEVVIYDAGGQRFALRQGGLVQIVGASSVSITAPAISLVGNVAVTGTLTDNGVDVGSDHAHTGVQTGGGTSGPPVGGSGGGGGGGGGGGSLAASYFFG